MKKQDFVKLAVMGLSSGFLITNQIHTPLGAEVSTDQPTEANGCGGSSGCSGNSDGHQPDDNGNIGFRILSEDELLLELNEKGEKLYMSFDEEGKELARRVASQRCNGTNECKGLNACQTADHACAGKGSCKGQGKCGFSDKNLAVKVVSMKMAEKRQEATN